MEKSFSLIWNENKDEVKFLQRAENIFECGKEGDFGPKKSLKIGRDNCWVRFRGKMH